MIIREVIASNKDREGLYDILIRIRVTEVEIAIPRPEDWNDINTEISKEVNMGKRKGGKYTGGGTDRGGVRR